MPPLIAIAAICIGLGDGPTGADLVDVGLLLLSIAGIAAFGHLLNDWTDIEVDAAGGKANAVAPLAPARRALLVGGTLVGGLLPWLLLPRRGAALVALAVEVGLLVVYSVPPVRLKGRGWLGALADASYAYAVPFVMVALVFAPPGLERAGLLVGLLGCWGLLLGLRGILWHQVGDLEADRAAGVETVASRMGPSRIEALVASVLLPFEIALGAALVMVAGVWWLPWAVLVFAVYRTFQVLVMWVPPASADDLRGRVARVDLIGFTYANEFVEQWLPLASMVALAAGSWWWWLATGVFFVLFANVVRQFLVHDLWVLPDALERAAFSRGIKAEIQKVEDARLARAALGPDPDANPVGGRFVFVVCGPISHLLTLRTAVHHLRPLTDAELWVVTDPARNEQVIDIDGLDRVVEVATPAELDHHQASIWLKTSVHRHVPAGEWCYLDSDIIAALPGMEAVFAERRGPVAFASDVTIRENSIDRFSPWAMTCPCLGYDDEHSCSHLREQLEARFGLDVPGDWLHWNGGVFLFGPGPDSAEFLEMWHERAVASFGWPEWKTRDQGALISTVWSLGLQDNPRLSPEFNFIADLGNGDLCLDLERGWAHHPSGPWFDAKLLHLYTSPLEDPGWELGADVEAVVVRRSRLRIFRYERNQLKSKATHLAVESAKDVGYASRDLAVKNRDRVVSGVSMRSSDLRWAIQSRAELLAIKARRLPARLTPARVSRSLRSRLGMDVSHVPIPSPREPEPQRSSRIAP
ncbi:MAG: 4-hydroxybenzoate polyprenyltransferase-like prenyltransferase [Ilumatobacteraceae bacterium]|nr:4-hydroxybenzoate polyprenyltransferase-like prenyltransferase [Ilumatobacteraceae bacterium]